MSVSKIKKLSREKNIKMLDLRFTDFIGRWKHVSLPIRKLDEDLFTNGIAFDGSSIPGFRSVEASDLNLIPDPATAVVDPFFDVSTIIMICNIVESDSKKPLSDDPRNVANKAEEYLRESGIADSIFCGMELEFYLLDDIKYKQDKMYGYYYLESQEGFSEEESRLGYVLQPKGGYFSIPPWDKLFDIRMKMMRVLEDCGVSLDAHTHECGALGQMEFAISHKTLLKAADTMMLSKYIIRNVAMQHGKSVTFMPKPINQEATNALHIHQSLYRKGKPLFYDGNGYAQLSKTAMHYIGGVLKHIPALLALISPSTNTYKRLLPRSEEPTKLTFSHANRTACIRIPAYATKPNSKRIELRAADSSSNIYLALAAILMAGLDGVKNRIDPEVEGFGPFDMNFDELTEEESKKMGIKSIPSSFEESLRYLNDDHEFLTRNNVFSEDMIQKWIKYKMEMEVIPIQRWIHPYEYYLYYDV